LVLFPAFFASCPPTVHPASSHFCGPQQGFLFPFFACRSRALNFFFCMLERFFLFQFPPSCWALNFFLFCPFPALTTPLRAISSVLQVATCDPRESFPPFFWLLDVFPVIPLVVFFSLAFSNVKGPACVFDFVCWDLLASKTKLSDPGIKQLFFRGVTWTPPLPSFFYFFFSMLLTQ